MGEIYLLKYLWGKIKSLQLGYFWIKHEKILALYVTDMLSKYLPSLRWEMYKR